jgi:4-amino-4-deoxy-L-arabinose transferase-like glycosyltransferase
MGAIVGLCAGRLANSRVAIFASVILSTSLMQAVLGRLAIMDALLDLAVTLTILALFVAFRNGRERYWYAAWIAAALGFLTKGPVAVVIPLLVIGAWLVWERRSGGAIVVPALRARIVGVLLFFSIAAPWFVLIAHACGPVALSELLGHYTVGRYLGTIENQNGAVWYYIPAAILGFFPWSAFLVPSLISGWQAAEIRAASSCSAQFRRLCLAWAILPFVFFSLAQTKLPNYIALEFPALAFLTAMWFDVVVDNDDRRALLGWAALLPVTIGAMGIAIRVFALHNRLLGDMQGIMGDLALLGLLFLTGSILCVIFLSRKRSAELGPLALAATSLGAMLTIALIEPHVERFKPIPTLARVIELDREQGDTVAIWGVAGANALLFYTRPPVAEFTPPFEAAEVRARICGAKRLFLVTSPSRASWVVGYYRRGRMLASFGKDALYLYDGPPCRKS